jgi:alkanesulfonate monooxygenase
MCNVRIDPGDEQGRDLGARVADIFLINGRPPNEVEEIVANMKERADNYERTLKFGMSAFVICRETEAAAQLEYQRLLSLLHVNIKGGDKEVAMHKYLAETEKVGTNGGTVAGLVGTPEQIAERMHEFEALGIETFLLQFHPTREELERFSSEVMPLLN